MAVDYDQQFTGVVEAIGIFPIKEHIKNQMVPSGQYKGEQFNIDKTHTIAFKIPELHSQWITVGHRKMREGYDLAFSIKKGDNYVDVWNGSTITFMYAENGGYINIEAKSIRALKLAKCEQKVYSFGDKKDGGSNTNSASGSDYNPKGAIEGNAFNCACEICKFKLSDPKFISTALSIMKMNAELKAKYKDQPGPAIGMAVLNASKATKNLAKVMAWAEVALSVTLPAISAGETPDVPKKKEKMEEPDLVDMEDDIDDIPF